MQIINSVSLNIKTSSRLEILARFSHGVEIKMDGPKRYG